MTKKLVNRLRRKLRQDKNLADRINVEYRACSRAAKDYLEHALEAGDLLLKAKQRCQHGEWLDWLNNYFEGSVRTAENWMKFAEKRPEIEAAMKSATVANSHLTVRQALALTASPKPKSIVVPPSQPHVVERKKYVEIRKAEVEESADKGEVLRVYVNPRQDALRKAQDVIDHLRWELLPDLPADGPLRVKALRKIIRWLEKELERSDKAS